jgi:ribosomal protein L37AE/L43A
VSERVIEGEVMEERIVACPQCGRRNRLYKRTATGVYKCGACRAALANPFATHAMRIPSMRNAGIIGASIFALLMIIVIVASNRVTSRTPIQSAATPASEIPTGVPRSGILFDAYPGSATEGEFTVINGSSRHAIAKVIDIASDRKILSFAIHAGKRTKITAIPDGTYNVIFAFGDRVYLGTDRFEKPRGFSRFDRPFTFTTRTTATETEEATLYRTSATALEVTLTPVIGGNITTSSISQQEFERY